MPAKIEGASHIDLWTAPPERFTIVTKPGQPGYHRRTALIDQLDEGLIASIMERGVLKPILVGRDGPDLIVIDGRQRVVHAREANRRLKAAGQEPKKIGFRTTNQPPERWGLLSEHANIHRKTPVSMQAEIARDLEEAGSSTTEIAEAMGQKPAYVEGLLRLLACDKVVLTAADKGLVSPTVARDLAELPREEQRTTLDAMVAKGLTKGAAARRAVSAVKRGKPMPEKTALRMRNRVELQTLADALAVRDLKDDGAGFLKALSWMMRDKTELPDDVAEVLDELAAAKRSAAA